MFSSMIFPRELTITWKNNTIRQVRASLASAHAVNGFFFVVLFLYSSWTVGVQASGALAIPVALAILGASTLGLPIAAWGAVKSIGFWRRNIYVHVQRLNIILAGLYLLTLLWCVGLVIKGF